MLCLLFVDIGCGEDFSDEDLAVFGILSRFEGRLEQTAGLDDAQHSLRVALLWRTFAPKGEPPFSVATDSAVVHDSSGAYSFALVLKHMPLPAFSIAPSSLSGGAWPELKGITRLTLGMLVVYEDSNQSGALELKEIGSPCSADQVRGVNQRLTVLILVGHTAKEATPSNTSVEERSGFQVAMLDSDCLPDQACRISRWVIPKPLKFGREVFQDNALTVALDEHLQPNRCEAKEGMMQYLSCSRLRNELSHGFETECPAYAPSCNPNKSKTEPVMIYQYSHQVLLGRLAELGCCEEPLGQRPWLCNPGHLGCPREFQCCMGLCQKSCDDPELPHWLTISSGSFVKGSPITELCRSDDENQASMTLTHDISMSTVEVTQQAFQTVMGYNPSFWRKEGKAQIECGPRCPVEEVSWHMAAAYCNELSRINGVEPCYKCTLNGGKPTCEELPAFYNERFYECPGYRLPTESEWEYAYRAGTNTAYYTGKNSVCFDKVDPLAEDLGWYYYNHQQGQNRMPHPVATKAPNGWGLYDVAGNVDEWVQDWYLSYQPSLLDLRPEAQTNPYRTFQGKNSGDKVFKGGSYYSDPAEIRAAANAGWKMDSSDRTIGFRCIRTAPTAHR